MLVSAIRQYGSAVGIHVFPLSGASSHQPTQQILTGYLFYFTYVSVYVSMLPFLTGCLFLENSSRHFLHSTPFILLNLRVSKGRGTCSAGRLDAPLGLHGALLQCQEPLSYSEVSESESQGMA